MNIIGDHLTYNATDLVGFLECSHLTSLDRAATVGHVVRPMRDDPVLDRIARRGKLHEQRFLESLQAEGLAVVTIGSDDDDPLDPGRLARGKEATLAAMRAGAEVIYQAVLVDERRLGVADFLRRVERCSGLGSWSYEVWDTKLARQAKASAVLQLCVYSDLLAGYQGMKPDYMHLALGGVMQEKVSFRFADYGAYYRMVAGEMESLLDQPDVYPLATEPVPVEHCDVCRWSQQCREQWRAQDDLSLVAGLTSRQRSALIESGITTRTGLGEALPERVDGIGRDALQRVQAQASIQVKGEQAGAVLSERIPPSRDREDNLVGNQGLLMLPEPSPGDLFFDIEGDPFFGSDEVDGIDYLFGVVEPGRPDDSGNLSFHTFWSIDDGAVTTGAERRAFEAFMDLVMDRLASDPGLHVYHYAPYEPTAVKRLAGRYGSREEEVDQLLRGGVFVDLYRAVRQGIRAAVESYSIKRLEPLYGYEREADLRDAGDSIVEFEDWLELGQEGVPDDRERLLAQIEQYNRDDCLSTWRLRDWLESQRAALADELAGGLPRPAVSEPGTTEDSEAQKQVNDLAGALIADLPGSIEDMDDEQRGQWLLAQLLNWHRREDKSAWWRYFYLMNELTEEERLEERDAMAGLAFVSSWPDPAPRARSTIYRFRFPAQEHRFQEGDRPRDAATGNPAGEVFAVDNEQGLIDLRLGSSRPEPTATSLIPLEVVATRPKWESLQRIALWVLQNDIAGAGEFAVARDLLARRLPRLGDAAGESLRRDGEPVDAAARRLVKAIDASYLAIQGPPGSGKSTVGGEMIIDLVEQGKKVGVTANSHKVIGELLAKAADAAERRGLSISIGQRCSRDAGPTFGDAIPYYDNGDVCAALAAGSVQVVGGTTWLWAREEMTASVDVLFIDEAGQMSLADAVAASPAAANLVLLGDPQQLDQPLQGVHPPGAERSVLGHVLGETQVMPDQYGLFLDGSWRLHPSISAYTSEVFYAGRLHSHPGRERLVLNGVGLLSGAGIRFLTVNHSGHTSEAAEEVDAVAQLVQDLLSSGATYTDALGSVHQLDEQDVLIISPYNLQVNALLRELPEYRIGTVDKFQGQEAPISIYSMATSSGEQVPHGMEFLYSLNRLNVATSRAQCLALVACSPGLLKVRCRTPRQMRLANALARLVEMASDW